jgi:hypothetical protein
MTMWARSDVCAINISEAHGGCGTKGGHRRPVEHGAPAKNWPLDCSPCEDHLRHDSHWSPTPVEVPETYDEAKARENFEKRGAKDKDAILTLALARLAGIEPSELPESLTRMISGVPAHVPGQMVCGSGHGNPPGQAFCGDCGAPMHGTPAQAALPAPQQAAETASKAAAGQKPRRLRDARLDELQALARGAGLDPEGTRADLIARLSAAGVTSAALNSLLVAA